MFTRHKVFTDVQYLSIDNTDSPVKRSRKEFLGYQQLRLLKHCRAYLLELSVIVDLMDSFAERAIRLFEYKGIGKFLGERFVVLSSYLEGPRGKNLVCCQKLVV